MTARQAESCIYTPKTGVFHPHTHSHISPHSRGLSHSDTLIFLHLTPTHRLTQTRTHTLLTLSDSPEQTDINPVHTSLTRYTPPHLLGHTHTY